MSSDMVELNSERGSAVVRGREYQAIIFDADGTLRECTVPGQPCPNAPGEQKLRSGVVDRLNTLDGDPSCYVISNQGGVAFEYLDWSMADDLLRTISNKLLLRTNRWPWLYMFCPHHPGGSHNYYAKECACRKPEPGMIYQVMDFGYAPNEVLIVGDMESDREAAFRARCDFIWASEFFNWEKGRDQR